MNINDFNILFFFLKKIHLINFHPHLKMKKKTKKTIKNSFLIKFLMIEREKNMFTI